MATSTVRRVRQDGGATPLRLSLQLGDVGHTRVIGPMGARKSVLLAFVALRFRRYPGAQIFAFDFDGSSGRRRRVCGTFSFCQH